MFEVRGNATDDQTSFGVNQVGRHVYNYSGPSWRLPSPTLSTNGSFTNANMKDLIQSTETISGFGGTACLPITKNISSSELNLYGELLQLDISYEFYEQLVVTF
jgi:hypothetical protein